MKTLSAEFKVGLLTLVALVVLVMGTLFVGNFQWFQKTYQMEIRFDFVSGLQEGAPVRLNGVKVGSVKSIQFRNNQVPPISVIAQISQDARLHKNTRAFINTMGLMGEKYLEIYAGTPDQPLLAMNEPIKGQSPTEIQEILNSSKSVADNLAKTMDTIADIFTQESTKMSLKNLIFRMDSISRNIDELVAGKRGDTEAFIKNLRLLSENMNRTVLEVNKIVRDNQDDTRKIFSNLANVSEDVKSHSSNIMTNLDKLTNQLGSTATESRPDLQTTLKNFRQASEDFKTTMKRLDNISAKIEKGEGTVGKIVNDEHLYGQATETVDAIRNVALSMSSSGKILSSMQFEYEMRYRDRLERLQNDIHLRITPNDKKYYIVGASDVGKKVGLDLIYARREGPVDIRLGVLESKAAAGLDYNIIKDRWLVGVQGVGLTEKHPRLDFQTQFKVGHYFDVDWYGIVGADNLTRDATVNGGLQIRY